MGPFLLQFSRCSLHGVMQLCHSALPVCRVLTGPLLELMALPHFSHLQ